MKLRTTLNTDGAGADAQPAAWHDGLHAASQCLHACAHLQFARQFLEKGNMVIAGVRDIYAPGLLELQKMHPDNLYVSAIDVENQRSIIVCCLHLHPCLLSSFLHHGLPTAAFAIKHIHAGSCSRMQVMRIRVCVLCMQTWSRQLLQRTNHIDVSPCHCMICGPYRKNLRHDPRLA